MATMNRTDAVSERAQETAQQARQSAAELEQRLEEALKQAGYVTLGAGDAMVEMVRGLAKGLPERAKGTPDKLAAFFEQTAKNLRSSYIDLADRGRKLTGQVAESPKVREAGEQTGQAKRQVKAAATSTRKAARTHTEAARSAAEHVGAEGGPPSASGSGPLEERTVDELRTRATELQVPGRSSMTKDELVAAIRDRQ